MVTIHAADHLAGTGQALITPMAAAKAETTFVDINLMPTGTFTGNVTLQNEVDHTNTVVYVTGSSNVAVTNEVGHYALTGVPIGEHTIQAVQHGWLDRHTDGILTAAGELVTLESLVLPRESNMAPTVSILPLPTFPVPNIYDSISFEVTAADVDGTIQLIEWDFEDDGNFDHSDPVALTVNWPIATSGEYRLKVRVTDDKGAIGLAALDYTVYEAVYVWGEFGDDGNPGTSSEPVKTIQHGISLAEVTGLPVIVHAGSYWEEIQFKSNVSVWGGYISEADWTRPPGSYSQVWLQSYYEHVVVADNVADATITGLEIEAETAQGDGTSAIALKLINCASSLVFNDCRIIAGRGAAAFAVGDNGLDGVTGHTGGDGGDSCRYQVAGCYSPGSGGSGGFWDGYSGGSGGIWNVDGEPGDGLWGGPGGTTVSDCPGVGGAGLNAQGSGLNGNYGQNATPNGSSYGTVGGQDWVGDRGATGDESQSGGGGSGGGGGGAAGGSYPDLVVGAGGGGGGGGAWRAEGGLGGYSGGASIAVLSIGSIAVIDSCHIQTGIGGSGWRGGNGGVSAPGGAGGFGGNGATYGSCTAGAGGNGAPGGSCGAAGGGQGGPGGPGGMHGSGGSQAPTGAEGPSAQTYEHP